MTTPLHIDLAAAVDALEMLPDRTPTMTATDTDRNWVANPASYRDGGVFLVHYAGRSEWERHPVGDEIVMVIEGRTTMTMLLDGREQQLELGPLQMTVVPQGTWHRFDTPVGVKAMTVTPQPTDHQVKHPLGH